MPIDAIFSRAFTFILAFTYAFFFGPAFLTAAPILDWSSKTPPNSRRDHTITAFQNKLWVIGGSGQNGARRKEIWNSSDGLTWRCASTTAPFGDRMNHATVVFQNRLWLLGGIHNGARTNSLYSSANGLAWDAHTTATAFTPRSRHAAAVFLDKLWVIGGDGVSFSALNDVWSTTDGIHWTQVTAAAPFPIRSSHSAFVADNKLWVMGGTTSSQMDGWWTDDGVQWHQESLPSDFPNFSHTAVRSANTTYLISTTGNRVYSRADSASSWTQIASDIFEPTTVGCASAALNGTIWSLGVRLINPTNSRPLLYSSPDGIAWTQANPDSFPADARFLYSAIANNQIYIVMGGNSATSPSVWVSATGEDWQLANSTPPFRDNNYFGFSLLPLNNRLYMTHATGKVWSSADGIAWTTETLNAGFGEGSSFVIGSGFVFQNSLYIAGYNTPSSITRLWRSANGATWELLSVPTNLNAFVTGSPAVAGTDGIRIFPNPLEPAHYVSTNALQWQSVPLPSPSPDTSSAILRFNNDWFGFGGLDFISPGPGVPSNKALYSTSGAAWTPIASDYSFPPVSKATAHYFKNRLWLVGGFDKQESFSIFSAPWPPASADQWADYE